MTSEEIIEMAKEAGICTWLKPPEDVKERLEAFAKLVTSKYEQEIQDFKYEILNMMERQDD